MSLVLLLSSALAGPPALDALHDVPGDDRDEAETSADLTGLDAPDIDNEIINGLPATADDFPAAGGLLADGTVGVFGSELDATIFMCSSTLIAPDVVLTAAHCVDVAFLEAQTGGLATIEEIQYVWSGEADLSRFGLSPTPPPLPDDAAIGWDWPSYPDFVGAMGVQIGLAENHDIALIFLEEPVLDVPYAYLPTPEEDAQLVEGAPVTIVGWGNQEPVAPGSQPQPGKVAVKMQAESVIGPVGPTEFQVGPAFEDGRKCQGDSGGPTFQEVETDSAVAWRVIGVTSHAWDETLCERTGGVDTRVSAYRDWIDQEMRSRCADGSRSWCEVEGIIPPPPPIERDGLVDDEIAEAGGCACSSSTVPGLVWLPLAGLAGILIRRCRR